MTIEMPVLFLNDSRVQKNTRTNKRQQKIKQSKLKPIPYSSLLTLRWVSEKWTSRNNLGDNYVLGGIHYETSASTVH